MAIFHILEGNKIDIRVIHIYVNLGVLIIVLQIHCLPVQYLK